MQWEETVVSFITVFQNLSTGYERNYNNSELIEKVNKLISITVFEIFLYFKYKVFIVTSCLTL